MTIGLIGILITAGVLCGLVSGLFGLGGGIVIVPVLYHLLPGVMSDTSFLMHTAVGTSLVIVTLTSVSSLIAHNKSTPLSWADLKWTIIIVALGSALAAKLSFSLKSEALVVFFGVFEIFIGFRLLRLKPDDQQQSIGRQWIFLSGSAVAGFVSALLGIGGGTLMTPWQLWFGTPIKTAIARSLALSIPIAAFGGLGYAVLSRSTFQSPYYFGSIYWPAVLIIASSSVMFAPVGAKWAHRLSSDRLQRLFAWFLVAVGIKMLW